MNPKCIIIKTQSKELFDALIYKIEEATNIRFWKFKINGFYTITIKCINYYKKTFSIDKNKLYGNYIFLYSLVSIILSELFISEYEPLISRRIILSKKHNTSNLYKLCNISALLLDENSPFEFSKTLYRKRKCFLLDSILKNFRKRNYIYTDNFIDFFAKKYLCELEKVIAASFEILNNKPLYEYMMKFVFADSDIT